MSAAAEVTRALTLLNEQGDTSITWTEDQDDEMEAIIEKKMAEGLTFFIVEPRGFGLLPPRKTPLSDATDARKHRALMIKDEDLSRFVSSGSGDVVKTPAEPVRKSRVSRNAKEIAISQSVAVKPMRGG
ncbi:hypothetical protein [Chelatococcus asaccharovorans]|uniref:Uncharacterized protein n=1 Tax=Chelatococcus asaccharovorans TaxID=28210 RepID=A0A2V3UN84_9HYPH|nr:hypothetical protein [Chelatococcus asaccharovorans]MBS7703259.1 hypothetical protein [Chelatococcus asaccharovorans]PXW61590.1 hypothetical protein C7450_103107 [Chelatococcus asaccharovorans]